MAVCPLLGPGPLQSGQSWPAPSCPFSSGSEDNIHSGSGWMGGQWSDALGAAVARVRGGTDATQSRSIWRAGSGSSKMPLAWVPEMAGPFFSWTPGSLSGSQSRLARRLPRRLCRMERVSCSYRAIPWPVLVGTSHAITLPVSYILAKTEVFSHLVRVTEDQGNSYA